MTTPPNNQPFCVFITYGEFCDKLFPFLLLLVGFYTSSYSPTSFDSLFVLHFSVLFDIQMLQFLSGQVYDHTIAREPIKEL